MFRPCRRIFQHLGGRISNSLVWDNFAHPLLKTYTFDFPTCTSVFSNTSFPTRIAQHTLSNMSFPTQVFQHDLCPNEVAPMYKICVWLFKSTAFLRVCVRPLVQNMVSSFPTVFQHKCSNTHCPTRIFQHHLSNTSCPTTVQHAFSNTPKILDVRCDVSCSFSI